MLKNISMSTGEKDKRKILDNATVLKEEKNIQIKEIENGFLLITNYETQYETANGKINWDYSSKEKFCKENPVKIEIKKEKSLADKME